METLNINTFIGKQVYNACKTLKYNSFDIPEDSKSFRYSLDNCDYEVHFINDEEFSIELFHDFSDEV